MTEGGEGAEVQVITLVTLNLWVWGFRVQPIIACKITSIFYFGLRTLK